MPFHRLDRRALLRSAGVAIGLPFLDAMVPAGAAEKTALAQPRRMLLIGRPLGLYTPFFFPETAGKDYQPSRYLKVLEPHRGQFTVFSGMSHRYAPGHYAEVALMTGVHPGQHPPERDPQRHLAGPGGGFAYRRPDPLRLAGARRRRRGVEPPRACAFHRSQRATQVFKQLFIQGTPEEEARELRRIRDGQSILDDVRGQVKTLNARLGDVDRDVSTSTCRRSGRRNCGCNRTRSGARRPSRWSRFPLPPRVRRSPAAPAKRAVVRPGSSGPADRFHAGDFAAGWGRRNGRRSTESRCPPRRLASRPGADQARAAGPDRGGGD